MLWIFVDEYSVGGAQKKEVVDVEAWFHQEIYSWIVNSFLVLRYD